MAWVIDVPSLNCSTAVASSPAAPLKSDFQAMPVPMSLLGTEARSVNGCVIAPICPKVLSLMCSNCSVSLPSWLLIDVSCAIWLPIMVI